MKTFFFTAVILLLSRPVDNKYQKVAFYFSGHPDDWQLFMGHHAWEDLQNKNTKVVFILTTAGDAWLGMKKLDNANQPYYKARETGFIHAVKWAAKGAFSIDSSGRATHSLSGYELDTILIEGHKPHPVKYFETKNAHAYLLYLYDGMPDGSHPNSLHQLKNGQKIYTIDSSTHYQSWEDLSLTIQNIVKRERGDSKITIHIAETDTIKNPGDHSDHRLTAHLANHATADICADYYRYVTYHSRNLDKNLSADKKQIKKFLFSANALAKEKAGYDSPWEPVHLSWTSRAYWSKQSCDN